MTNRYRATKQSLEEQVIKKIEDYIAEQHLTYTANSPDFVRGLILGLDVGMKTMFYNIVGDDPDELDSSGNSPDNDKIAEYLNNTNINETPPLPNIDTKV